MIHKEGKWSLILFFTILILGLVLLYLEIFPAMASFLVAIGGFFIFFFLQFFRNPKRAIESSSKNKVYVPCDGKIVVIEEVYEPEYFNDKRLQVSIFMSPLNVHVNRAPFDGTISYKQHHKGKFLMAFNPKSSIENERCTTVFCSNDGTEILYRQVAGFLARRIVNYVKKGDVVIKGKDYGFIKLGSRVDIFLPIGTVLNVEMNQVVKGNIDILATFNGQI